MQIGIVEPTDFPEKALSNLGKLGQVCLKNNENIDAFVKDKEVLFIRLKYFFDKELLAHANKLQFLCSPTTGLNHIDQNEINNKKIQVISLKGEGEFLNTIRATPEHTFGLIIALLRNYKIAFLNEKNALWNRDKYKGFELYQKNIGIIGLGRVGTILAKYLKTFEANVFYYDTNPSINNSDASQMGSIPELIKKCEIILLCASYSANNQSMINREMINLMKDKFFINTARGELIDEEYMIKKIGENHFKGIALDVISDENKESNNLNTLVSLTENRNFILTPHIAGATYESMSKTEEFIVDKLEKMLNAK